MSKISLEVPFTAFKGKICKHTNIIYKQLRDTQFTSQICHPRTKAYSEEELARQAKFKTAAVLQKLSWQIRRSVPPLKRISQNRTSIRPFTVSCLLVNTRNFKENSCSNRHHSAQ